MSQLRIRVASKHFGATPVLQDIALDVAQGEIVCVVGASGCGKSTLLRLVSGLDRQYRGDIHLEGRALSGITSEIGFIFQEPRLLPWLTLAQNVAFDLGADAAPDPRARELIRRVGLAGYETALPKALSGGMAQRAAIARGLFRRPRVLLLDEPFSAVDAFTRIKLQDLLLDVTRPTDSEPRTTLLLVTHDVDEAVYLADRVVVMSHRPGRIAEEIAVNVPRPRSRRSDALVPVRRRVLAALETIHAI
jgi:sulfonate transport system ATP-binding protein